MIEDVSVRRVTANEAAFFVDRLADILVDCVEGGASVSFMWPLPRARALAFWRGVANDIEHHERVLLVAEDRDGQILGTVQMIPAESDNQPYRADVAKMLVHREARRRGIGQRLMAAIADVARVEGKTVLLLNTKTGSPAERLYDRIGWRRAGTIPKCALTPTGELCGKTIYYKHL